MKIIALTVTIMYSSLSFAWISPGAPQKDYHFKFNLAGKTLEVRQPASSYEDAFEKAAQQCFSFYKGKGKVSESRGLDIIDVCANPRS